MVVRCFCELQHKRTYFEAMYKDQEKRFSHVDRYAPGRGATSSIPTIRAGGVQGVERLLVLYFRRRRGGGYSGRLSENDT